jgi:hypothetical protein
MKLIKSICIVFLAGIALAGCTTTGCEIDKTVDGEFTTTVTRKDSFFSKALYFGGQTVATIAAPGLGNLAMYGGNKLLEAIKSDTALTPEQKSELIKEAQTDAEKYVRENPDKFCNRCRDEQACPANLVFKAHGLQVVDTELTEYKDTDHWKITIKYKVDATLNCGKCTDETCGKSSVSSENQKLVDAPLYCEKDPGTTMVVIDEATIVPLDDLIEIMAE